MATNAPYTRQDLIDRLTDPDPAASPQLCRQADIVRREEMGDAVHLRALIEFANVCSRDCLYCGLRRSNGAIRRYRMSADEILQVCRESAEAGFRTVVLQSGEGSMNARDLCDLVSKIKSDLDMAVTLSVGELPRQSYVDLKAAGADRFLLKFETSDPALYAHLKPDSHYSERFRCLADLREAGFQVGSGIMVGLPGQTPATIAEDLIAFYELGLDMIGIGPYIPHPETPLQNAKPGTLGLTLRVLALARLMTRNTHLPATTSLGTLSPNARARALKSGANVLMPNVTPRRYEQHYDLYPGKPLPAPTPADAWETAVGFLQSIERPVGTDRGESPKAAARAADTSDDGGSVGTSDGERTAEIS